jgi:hypothetical protein
MKDCDNLVLKKGAAFAPPFILEAEKLFQLSYRERHGRIQPGVVVE